MRLQTMIAGAALLSVGALCGWLAGAGRLASAFAQDAKAPDAEQKARDEAVAKESPLDKLDWLIGDWVAASEDVTAEFSCDFTKNNSFIIRPFRIVRKDGESFSGTQLIAWDPAQETIRSWTFDSNGGFGEESWSQSGNRYSIRAKYTLPDGGKGSAIHVMNFVDHNTFTWKSINREIDGQLQPDTAEVTLVRKQEVGNDKGGK